jgi:hypothetical protein
MNILIRKLIYNEENLHLITWQDRPCFFVSELSKAFDSGSKDAIPIFLRRSQSQKGTDYDVINGENAKQLKSLLEDSGIKKKFSQTMIVYFEGLKKYLAYKKTMEARDFISYLSKCKISLDADFVASVGAGELPAASVEAPAAQTPQPAAKPQSPSPKIPPRSAPSHYEDLLKHLAFMEDFVTGFNKAHIPQEKAIEFTKHMVKFLEDNGTSPSLFLCELKKWNS